MAPSLELLARSIGRRRYCGYWGTRLPNSCSRAYLLAFRETHPNVVQGLSVSPGAMGKYAFSAPRNSYAAQPHTCTSPVQWSVRPCGVPCVEYSERAFTAASTAPALRT